ncbi:MAG: 16S rRNA (guanine(966)-N(2))-methyltransferase RsmD [Nitrospirota bacterium]|nr:MAG: 16S rRNA (guanine(966)-N(2))-methyltransferase RsmD [Nitrospirota bacterium]
MRIISGRSKGRKIRHDGSDDLRPTSSKVRESIFNILSDKIENSRFLDLFAGTGAVGIEALSRGASECTFVESNSRRVKKLKNDLEALGLSGRSKVVHEDSMEFIVRAKKTLYDIIFADPPYDYKELEGILDNLANMDIIDSNGIVVIEHSSKRKMQNTYGNIKTVKTYKYGDTSITKFRRSNG